MNVSIVSDVPPDENYTAGQVLKQLIEGTKTSYFYFHWLNQSLLNSNLKLPDNCELAYEYDISRGKVKRAVSFIANKLSRKSKVLKLLFLPLRALIYIASLVAVACKMTLRVKKEKTDIIWLVMQGDRALFCYYFVMMFSGKNYILHQWDPMSWWFEHRSFPAWFQKIARKYCSKLERGSVVNIVPSASWVEKMKSEGCVAIRLDNFLSKEDLKIEHEIFISERSVLHAVFLGQFYANTELIDLVDSISGSLKKANKKLIVHYYGYGAPDHIGGCKVISHGACSKQELIRDIRKWNLALLPYPQLEVFEETSRLSFPSKSRVYLAAGLPVISNASLSAGVHDFFSKRYEDFYLNIQETEKSLDVFVRQVMSLGYDGRMESLRESHQIVSAEFSAEIELDKFELALRGKH